MPQALPLQNRISQGSTRKRVYRALTAQFGDGYQQDVPDGVNHTRDEWMLRYDNLTTTERTTFWSAIDAVGSWDYLTWTANGDSVAKKWKVVKDGVTETPAAGDLYSVSLSIRQVF